MAHSMYIGPPCFPVFNDRPDLGAEPIASADIVPFRRSESPDMVFAASAAWSADCEWYFIILPEGIALLNVNAREGLLCRKHSAAFIGWCLESGVMSRKSKKLRTREQSEPLQSTGGK